MRLALLPALLALAVAAAPAHAQIRGGTYTLDPASGDFRSFEEAAATLQDEGIDGPVIIEVAQAVYAERVEIGQIPGASGTSTVTFRGIPDGGALPTLSSTPSSVRPYVLRAEEASWVRFESIRFEVSNRIQSRGTVLSIESDDVEIIDCEVVSIHPSAVGSADAVGIDIDGARVRVESTTVSDGAIGIRLGPGRLGASGSLLLDNRAEDNRSIGILVEDQSTTSGNAVSIRGNRVTQAFDDEAGWVGIWLRDNTGGAVLARNAAFVRSGTGIRVERVTNATTAWTSVVNNAVFGSRLRYDTSAEGIEILDAVRVRVLNNSVYLEESVVEERNFGTALRIDAASAGVRVVNNILIHDGSGPSLDIESLASVTDLDYQLFESITSPGLLRVRIGGVDYTDLPAYRAATGGGANAVTWSVEFSGSNLRLTGRSDGDGTLIGRPEPGVPADIDGDSRDPVRPYRGADEAPTPLADPPPRLSGAYTIAADGTGSFESFTEAISALETQGVGGPVTFTVRSGTYDGLLRLGRIPAISPGSPVRFVGDGSLPLVRAAPFSPSFDRVLRLTNVRHVTFEGLAFQSQSSTYPGIVWIRGGYDILFDRCEFRPASSAAVGTHIYVGGLVPQEVDRNPRDIRIHGSTFLGGRRAIDLGLVNQQEGGFEVIGNTVIGQNPEFDGIRMGGNARGVIQRNVVSSPTSGADFVGIEVAGTSALNEAESPVVVDGNQVTANDGVGILWGSRWLRNPEFYTEGRLEVTNNIVRMNGDGPAVGLRTEQGIGPLFAHNTLSVASTDPASAAAVIDASTSTFSSDVDLRNNIFDAHLGRALDLTVGGLSTRYRYDDNIFWSDGAVLARYAISERPTVDCADLACIRAASLQTTQNNGNQDLESIVYEVAFVDAAGGDLRLAPSMDRDPALAGAPLPEVPTDLDGDPRAPDYPYRGADEGPSAHVFAVVRLRAYLQGPFIEAVSVNAATQSTALQDAGLLPLSNPYAASAFDGTLAEHDGTESMTQAGFDAIWPITDWVVVELRQTLDGPAVYRGAYLLSSIGWLYGFDERGLYGLPALTLPVAPGDYHVAIYHRNHLPIISTLKTLNAPGETVAFIRMYIPSDLADGGASMIPLGYAGGSPYAMVAGDGSGDGTVGVPDVTIYSGPASAGAAGYLSADYSLDGFLSAPDFNLWRAAEAAGATTSVPLPGSLARRPSPAVRDADAPRRAAPDARAPDPLVPEVSAPELPLIPDARTPTTRAPTTRAPERPLTPSAPTRGEGNR